MTNACPICGVEPIERLSSWLPHFFVCARCGGLVGDDAPVDYPEEYFSEGGRPTLVARLAKPALDLFLHMRLRTIRRALRGAPNRKILDYGCGNGKVVAFARARGLDVVGYDPSPGAVALAKSRGLPVSGELPEPRGEFGLVMLWHSLEHTPDPLVVLQRVNRLLAAGGKLVVAVPNAASWEASLARERWFCYDWPRHRVHFTPKTLADIFSRAGFASESLDLMNPEYTLSSIAQTLLNLFFPADVLYSVVAHRRMSRGRLASLALAAGSAAVLLLTSPVLLLWFFAARLFGKTGAMIMTGRKIKSL